MPRLTARFDFQFPDGNFLVNYGPDHEFRFQTRLEDFDVELDFNPDYKIWRKMFEHTSSKPKVSGYSKIQIFVSRLENIELPSVEIIDDNTYRIELDKYLGERRLPYREIALKGLNRALLFFKYKLHNPKLQIIESYGNILLHPTWLDKAGKELKNPGTILSMEPLPAANIFNIKYFSEEDKIDFYQALNQSINISLPEELLSDAQNAVFENNYRRAVLELAIACEVAVKQAFFAENTAAGAAFEYLERKRKVEVTVVELIHGVAKQAFGESFKEFDYEAFQQVDYLFRGRNKVAHRGKAIYRDNKGNLLEIDRQTLIEWWKSVTKLFKWLNDR